MKKYLFILILFLNSYLNCFAQKNNNDISILVGYEISLMHQLNKNDINNIMNSYNFGFVSKQEIKSGNTFNIGLIFSNRKTNNYLNSVSYISNWLNGPETTKINLKTSFDLSYLEIPLNLIKQFKNKFSIGGGICLSYLLYANLNQEALGEYAISKYPLADKDFTASIKYVFGIKNYKTTAPFLKSNIAPVVSLGYKISNKLNAQYTLSYDLFANPVMEFKFNNYNLIKNNFSLIFKINKK